MKWYVFKFGMENSLLWIFQSFWTILLKNNPFLFGYIIVIRKKSHCHFILNILSFNFFQSRDMYFLQKLLNLKGDDGFRMNEVLVSLWYIMGLWPLVYSMLLLPTGRRYLSFLSLVNQWFHVPFLLQIFFLMCYKKH